ncbi:MAG: hypothetical protein ACYC7E_17995 [Armatimonadota bacterium]
MIRFVPTSLCLRAAWLCALAAGVIFPANAQTPETLPGPASVQLPASTWSKGIGIDRPLLNMDLVGTIQRVNAGQISPWDYQTKNSSNLECALGLGMVPTMLNNWRKFDTVGTMVTFAGRTFIKTNDSKAETRVLEVSKSFQTPFCLSVGTIPNDIFPRPYRLTCTEPRLLHSVLEELANDAGSPIGVLAWVEMPEVNGVSFQRAPSEGESLLGEKRGDYLETVKANDASVVFFGAVSPVMQRPSLNATMIAERALGLDLEQGIPASALILVHGATIAEPLPLDYNTRPILATDFRKVTVKDVMQIQGTSTVKRGIFFVFRLNYASI